MDTTTAIIQFIGIVLFTSAVPNDPGVHAILPKVVQGSHSHMHTGDTNPIAETDVAEGGSPTDSTMTGTESDGIEEHVAVILYRTEDRLAGSGTWNQQGTLKNGWEYLKLEGEHVQFLTNGVNEEPKVPDQLPRAAAKACQTELGAETPQEITLKDDFQMPYPGAAGVVDIPAGTLSACKCDTPETLDRIDTTLSIATEGVLVIAAKTPGEKAKSVTLDGDAIVFVANVPPHHFFTTVNELPAPTGPHWQAYNEMLDPTCSSEMSVTPVEIVCERVGIDAAAMPAEFSLIDSSCSNSQWP